MTHEQLPLFRFPVLPVYRTTLITANVCIANRPNIPIAAISHSRSEVGKPGWPLTHSKCPAQDLVGLRGSLRRPLIHRDPTGDRYLIVLSAFFSIIMKLRLLNRICSCSLMPVFIDYLREVQMRSLQHQDLSYAGSHPAER